DGLCPGSIPSENATKGNSHREHTRHEPWLRICNKSRASHKRWDMEKSNGLCPGSIPSENATKGNSHREHTRHEPWLKDLYK
ncbi:MAG: hypothetical protein K6A45_02230, partial [Lachnospiraceae bacterium]|nr:hypothetical protein [Lachnospiraceae bacterium]